MPEHNKDYYDPNVVSTSFGRNKTSSPQTAHSQGQRVDMIGEAQGGDGGSKKKKKKMAHMVK